MSDLIDRQAAIDALSDYIHNVDKVYCAGRLSAEDCKDAAHSVLDELPSAEKRTNKRTETHECDLISRQAAIEIIQSMYPQIPRIPWMRKDWQERYEPYIRTENAIRNLPSAQIDMFPLLTEEEKQQNRWYAEGYGDAIKELSAQPTDADIQKMQDIEQAMLEKAYECGKQDAAQWIPCSERLPKPYEYCLWATTDGRVIYHHCDGLFSNYTAWMPLPKPYKEDTDE